MIYICFESWLNLNWILIESLQSWLNLFLNTASNIYVLQLKQRAVTLQLVLLSSMQVSSLRRQPLFVWILLVSIADQLQVIIWLLMHFNSFSNWRIVSERQSGVHNLPNVATRWLESDLNPLPSGCRARILPLFHRLLLYDINVSDLLCIFLLLWNISFQITDILSLI